jgi:ketosteroid isomerase-like protein
MQKITAIFFCVALLCCTATAQSNATEQTILKLEQEWVEALTKADAAALERLYSEGLTYTHSSG